MSYGQNLPWGLQPVKSLGSSTWNNQTNPYFINPTPGATTQSIFRGDPVILNASGYVVSLYEAGGAAANTPILGVFNGCSYVTPTSVNPIDPASPGRPFWPAGTLTLNNTPVTAFIVDDPNTIYNVQTNASPGLGQTNMGNTAPVAFQVASGLVQGNTNTGISLVSLDQANVGTSATLNLKILRLVARADNALGLGYNNVEVLIQNHFFCSRPAGV
ncbi:MAG: hypothetical protein RLY40_63 [Pseudomonadota bacterium]|jgi:hypothetical protein